MRRCPKLCPLTRQLYLFADFPVYMQLTNHGSFLPEAVLPGNTASIHFCQTSRQTARKVTQGHFFHKEEHALLTFYSLTPILGPSELPKSYQKPPMRSLRCTLNSVCTRPTHVILSRLPPWTPFFFFFFPATLRSLQDLSSSTRDRIWVHGRESAES